MEAWHRLSALGGAGALGIWRGSLSFLSARFMDAWRRAWRHLAVESCTRGLLLDCSDTGWSSDVPACAPVASDEGCVICGDLLRVESLPFVDCLLAERVCRVARGNFVTAGVLFLLRLNNTAWCHRSSLGSTSVGSSSSAATSSTKDEFNKPGEFNRATLCLSLTLAAAWLTNLPAAIMIHYSVGGLALLLAGRAITTERASTQRLWSPRVWHPLLRDGVGCSYGDRPGIVLSVAGDLRTALDRCRSGALTGGTAAG